MEPSGYRCGMEAAVDLIAGKWKLLILYHLGRERLRFAALRRVLGDVSEKVLAEQLKAMTADGLVRRIDFRTVPPHVEYELTEFGRDFCQSFSAVCEWGDKNMDRVAKISSAKGREDTRSGPKRKAEA